MLIVKDKTIAYCPNRKILEKVKERYVKKKAKKYEEIPMVYDKKEKCYDVGYLSAGNEYFEKKDYENAMKNYFKFLDGAKDNQLRRLSGLSDEQFVMEKFMRGMRYTLPELACRDMKTYIESEYFELLSGIN